MKIWTCLLLVLALACPALAAFEPRLDEDTACDLRVVANYDNFEALEAEFDRFNDYYPDVNMSYDKLDDYKNTIRVALSNEGGPDIYAAFAWMVEREEYQTVFDAAVDLGDPALGIDLSCIRENVLYRDASGGVPMVTVFTGAYGMLVNDAIFADVGIEVPRTFPELVDACGKLRAAGYEHPLMGFNHPSNGMAPCLSNPLIHAAVRDDPEAVSALNALDPAAGEILRPMLERVNEIRELGLIDLQACEEIEDNYSGVILRFFEGDVPMMICNGDVASGTKKRESLSEAYTAHPFPYTYHLLPTADDGAYFLNTTTMCFAINAHSENLEMAEEFMRFLVSTEELSHMAQIKRVVTPTVDMSLDEMYAALGEADAQHSLAEVEIGLLDAPITQARQMAYNVLNGLMTVDEAVEAFGRLEKAS